MHVQRAATFAVHLRADDHVRPLRVPTIGLQVVRLSIERHTHALVPTNHRTHTKSTPPGTAADRGIFLAYQLLETRVNSSSAPFRTT